MACDVRIGTSGWSYPWWIGKDNFYPEGTKGEQMLPIYLDHFDSVEINNSFYHLPLESTLEKWRRCVRRNFVFAAKGSRFLTHMKKLKDPREGIARYFERIEFLGPRLGPVIWQLPPRWKKNVERLDAFLRELPKRHRYAFEFRDLSWHDDEVLELLRKHNAAFCIHEIAGIESKRHLTADFTYVRLHGPAERAYEGSYTRAQLQRWAAQIGEWEKSLRAVYFYFDNDQIGHAARNAIDLKRIVENRDKPRRGRESSKENASRLSSR